MPVSVALPPVQEAPRKRWSREEFRKLSDEVVSYERLELIDGDLISKMGKKRPHVIALNLVRGWLAQLFNNEFVNSNAPVDVSAEDNLTNEPEPDVIVLGRSESEFLSDNPGPEDVRLVVEVSDISLSLDLRKKARLYARAGFAEYWVVDVQGRRLIAHRDPEGGNYRTVLGFGEDESIAPLAAPQSELLVKSILSPAQNE